MTLKTLAAASCLSVAMTTSTIAAPVTIDFAFDDVTLTHGATGTLYGLDDSDGTSSATSFDLFLKDFSWTNVSAEVATENEFRFFSGEVIAGKFSVVGPLLFDASGHEALYDFSFDLFGFGYATVAGGPCCREPNDEFLYVHDGWGVRFSVSPVAAVPLPAGGLLLLSGLGGVAALKRRKKRAA